MVGLKVVFYIFSYENVVNKKFFFKFICNLVFLMF